MHVALTFRQEKETKGTFRFKELNAEGKDAPYGQYMVGTLYVRKDMFKGRPAPEKLEVTVEY